jgi:hypothetical protein
MEAVGSAAAITQLLGQTITIVQTIRTATRQVRETGIIINDSNSQLDNLLSTLNLVQNEKELQTLAIAEQLSSISSISGELQAFLDTLTARQAKSAARQFMHAITTGDEDKTKLGGFMDRLDRAMNSLNMRIITANVGVTGDVRSGLIAAWPVIQRVDENVRRALGERMRIAQTLEARGTAQGGMLPMTRLYE